MFKFFDRYILREVVPPFFLGLLIYSFVLLMNQLLQFPELFIAKGVALGDTLRLLYYLIPAVLSFTIPMAVLMGILAGLGRMSSDAEIMALRTLGISPRRLLRPLLVVALLGWLATSVLTLVVTPRFNFKWTRKFTDVVLNKAELQFNPREFNESITNVVLYIQNIDAEHNWTNVFVAFNENPEKPRVVMAQRGRLHLYPETKKARLELWDVTQHFVNLSEPDTSYSVTTSEHLEEALDIESLFPDSVPEKRAREKNIVELVQALTEIRARRTALEAGKKDIDRRGLGPAVPERAKNDFGLLQAAHDRRATSVEIHKRFALPFVCWIFVFLGLPLGSTTRKGGRTSGFTLSLVIILVYYIGITAGEQTAMDGRIPPFLGMWGPNIVFGAFSLFLFLASSRESPLLGIFRRRSFPADALGKPDSSSRPGRRILHRVLGLGIDGAMTSVLWFAAVGLAALMKNTSMKGLLAVSSVPFGLLFFVFLAGYIVFSFIFLGESPGVRLVTAIMAPGSARRLKTAFRFPNILDRYVIRKYLFIWGLVILSIIAVSVIVTFFDRIGTFYEHNKPLSNLLTYIRFRIPEFIHFGLPASALISSLLTLGLLTKTNEITAMKACGISVYRAILPVAAMAVLVGGLAYYVQEVVYPRANKKAEETWNKIIDLSTQNYSFENRRWVANKASDRFYHYSYFDAKTSTFNQLAVYDLALDSWSLARRSFAERAVLAGETLRFEDGWIRSDFLAGPKEGVYINKKSLDVPIEEGKTLFIRESKAPSQMNYRELERYIKDVRGMGFETVRYEVSLASKISFPFVSFIMILLGIPFAFSMGKKGTLVGLGVGIGIAMIYWVAIGVFMSLGNVGLIPVFLASWGPNLIFGLTGLYLLLRTRT